jgi:hypothetical protein
MEVVSGVGGVAAPTPNAVAGGESLPSDCPEIAAKQTIPPSLNSTTFDTWRHPVSEG